jgi:four helix bundle protein
MKTQFPTHGPRGSTLDAYRVALELLALLHEPLLELRKRDPDLERQARRALQSIVHNTAEGEGKVGSTRREQARFFSIARGSTHELQAALHTGRICRLMDVAVLDATDELLDRERAMLYRLITRA